MTSNNKNIYGSHLDDVLIHLNDVDKISLREMTNSTLVFGQPGSAKTTSTFALIVKGLLASGMGVCFPCIKGDMVAYAKQWAKDAGREKDVIVVSPQSRVHFNPLRYLHSGPWASARETEQTVDLVTAIFEKARGGGSGRDDRFFRDMSRRTARALTDITKYGGGELSFSSFTRTLQSAPKKPEDLDSEDWCNDSNMLGLVTDATNRDDLTERERKDLELSAEFALGEWSELGDRTRSSCEATFHSEIDSVSRGTVAALIEDGPTNIVPEDIIDGRAIVILDVPVLDYGSAGVLFQLLFIWCLTKAIQKRDLERNPAPVALLIDEADKLIFEDLGLYLSTSRSMNAINVFAVQSLPSLELAYGGGAEGKTKARQFAAMCGLKIFHSNLDPETNKFASDIGGPEFRMQRSFNNSLGSNGMGPQMGAGGHEALLPRFPPTVFSQLACGGPSNNFIAESIWFAGHKTFETSGTNALLVQTPQTLLSESGVAK